MLNTLTAEVAHTGRTDDWKPVALKVLVGFLVVFLLAELAFYLVVIPTTSTVRLTVEGAPSVGYDELCSIAGLDGSEKWIRFNTASTAARLASNPLFESVTVEKKFPDRVVISVKERIPVAVSLGVIDGRTVPVEIDRKGVAFRIGRLPAKSTLPLITGLTFENPVPGMRLDSRLRPLLENLADIGAKNPVLLASVSEIKIDEKAYGGYDLVVYPVHTPVRVRTDKALNEDALQYMMLVLDVVKNLDPSIDEIDIRAGTVSYRAKGETL
jgi:cell division protein FtsQ